MGLLGVMFILVLGYRYAASIPHQKNILKRSAGWESYVYLAQQGIICILHGILIYAFFILIFWLLLELVDWILVFFNDEFVTLSKMTNSFARMMPENNIYYFHFIVLVVCSWVACEGRVQEDIKREKYESLRSLDGVLGIVIQALQASTPVKISLKSRKVYVGLVVGEQFENVDLDNIIIIPFASGYRDKDTLRLKLDCSYVHMYGKNGFIDENSETGLDLSKFDEMKLLVRVDEIETISLFNPEYYQDFGFISDSNQP